MPVHHRWTGIVCGQGQGYLALIAIEQFSEVARAAHDVVMGIKGIVDVQGGQILRHDLHEPQCPFARNRLGIESRFGANDGFEQWKSDVVAPGGLADDIVIGVAVAGRGRRPAVVLEIDLVIGRSGHVGKVHDPLIVDVNIDIGSGLGR